MAEEMNPGVANILSDLSPEMSGMMGGAPPPPMSMPGNGRPKPAFVTPAPAVEVEKPLNATQVKQVLAEAASPKGFSTLASKRFAQLGPLMPGAEKVRIRKRRDDGSVASLRDYNYRDVEQQGDVEAFVQMYLFPKYGGGDYEVYLIDSGGKEYNAGIVRLWGAPKDPDTEAKAAVAAPDPAAGMMPLMVEMYRKSTTPGPDPFAQMLKMKEFLSMDQKPADNNPMIQMMQMQMQAQQAQQQLQMQLAQQQQASMMALLAPKPQDDRIAQMLERMDRRLEKLETAPPPPPPPMMAPQGPNTAELLTAIGGLAASIVPLIKGDGIKATEMAQLIISAQQAAKPTDALGVRDVISIFQDKEARQSPPATLEEQFGMVMRAKELAQALSPAPQGPQGTTFWDALGALFGNGDFARAIGARVGQGVTQQPSPITVTSLPQQPRQTGPQQLPPSGETQQPQQEQVQLPADFAEKCKAIEAATEPGARVAATVDTLMSLRGIPQWQPFVQALLESVARGEKRKAIGGLATWFERVPVAGGMLSRDAAVATVKTFDMAFELVRQGVLEQAPMLRGIAAEADAARAAQAEAQAAAAPVEVAQAQPVVETEVPTGPPPVHVDIGDADAAAYSHGSL